MTKVVITIEDKNDGEKPGMSVEAVFDPPLIPGQKPNTLAGMFGLNVVAEMNKLANEMVKHVSGVEVRNRKTHHL